MTDRDAGEAGADGAQISEDTVTSVPLEDEDGDEYVISQQNVEYGDTGGSGGWPHPATPARGPSPGAVDDEKPEDR